MLCYKCIMPLCILTLYIVRRYGGLPGLLCWNSSLHLKKGSFELLKGLEDTNTQIQFFLDLNILKLEDVNIYCCAIYVFKSLNNITENKYFTYRVNEFHSLRNADLLRLPAVRSTQSKRYINYHGVEIWNSLPPNIRNKTSIQSFKIALKKYLLNRYDNNENTWFTLRFEYRSSRSKFDEWENSGG